MSLLKMSGLQFSFSKSLVGRTTLAFISAFYLSSVALAMEPEEDKSCVTITASSHKGSSDIASQLKNDSTVINFILVFLDPQSLLYMGTTSKAFHQLCINSALWDALFQRNLYPSTSLTNLHLKSPSNYYGLAHFLQEVLLPSAIRQGSEFKIPTEVAWWENMISQAFSENSPQGNYLLGLLYEASGLNQKAFDAYEQAANKGCVKSQFSVATALYEGKSGQDKRSKQERFEELKTRAAMGDQHAQVQVNNALFYGQLDQGKRFKQERFEELETRASQGDQSAKQYVTEALYCGNLGQGRHSQQERFAKLQVLASQGNQFAQVQVSNALFYGQLGQGERSEKERFNELKLLTSQGKKFAKRYVDLCLV
ncbi:hypothetical protein QPK87_26575 [Kamptonema cortianum]|nr:hypothetical protein [Geitlerinema splendidum]MDK3160098.1 hypothetical protein [Kamptonema cortianum]